MSMLYYRIKNEDLYKRLLSDKLRVASHRDADGVYSLALLSSVFSIPKENTYFPDIFGDYDKSWNVSLDLGEPKDQEWEGLAIDHHFHPNINDRKYSLIVDSVPTGLMVYNLFKDKIKKEDTWKVAGSLVGDMQPYLIPDEVFDQHPILLEKRGTVYSKEGAYGLKLYYYYVYKLLSSPVNATCRVGKAEIAYEILSKAKSPDDILTHPVFLNDQKTLNKEMKMIIEELGRDRKRNTQLIKEKYLFVPINSSHFIASWVASAIAEEEKDMSIIVVNEENGEISIRGELLGQFKRKMATVGWEFGGHSVAMGGLLGDRTLENLLDDARKVL